jgi:hypothetical protein
MTISRSDTLRALADLLEQHPEVEMPYVDPYGDEISMIRFQLTSHGEEAAATAARIVKAFPGSFRKDYDESYFTFYGEFVGVPVEVRTMRADVCVARQVGTRTVAKPDPDALAEVPLVEVEVPVFEYDCKPVLAEAAS